MAKSAEKLPRGIDRKPGGQYRARIFRDGKRHTLGAFQAIGDAEAALSIARGEIARGTFVPPDEQKAQRIEAAKERQRARISVDQLAEQWFAWLEKIGRSRGTVYTYRSRYRTHIAPTFGVRPVVDVTGDDVDDWHADLLSAHGNGVARPAYLTLSSLFQYAAGKARDQPRSFVPLIPESPVQTVGATKHKRVKDGGDTVLTPSQVRQVAAEAPERYKLAVLLSGTIALRLGEVLALRRGDVATDPHGQAWLRVERQLQARGQGLYVSPPKSEAGIRDLPIPAHVAEHVTDHLKAHVARAKASLLFPRTNKGAEFTHPNTLRNAFNSAVEAAFAGMDEEDQPGPAVFHTLRHSALTRLGQQGATLAELMTFAGHSDSSTVLKYQHSTRNRLAMLAASLEEGAGA